MNKQFSLLFAPMYVQKGATNGQQDLDLDYLAVPILVKYAHDLFGLETYIMAGGEFGLSVNSKPDVEPNSIDYGLCVGVGFDFNIVGLPLCIEGAYTHGLREVTDLDKDVKNQSFRTLLGVRL